MKFIFSQIFFIFPFPHSTDKRDILIPPKDEVREAHDLGDMWRCELSKSQRIFSELHNAVIRVCWNVLWSQTWNKNVYKYHKIWDKLIASERSLWFIHFFMSCWLIEGEVKGRANRLECLICHENYLRLKIKKRSYFLEIVMVHAERARGQKGQCGVAIEKEAWQIIKLIFFSSFDFVNVFPPPSDTFVIKYESYK